MGGVGPGPGGGGGCWLSVETSMGALLPGLRPLALSLILLVVPRRIGQLLKNAVQGG